MRKGLGVPQRSRPAALTAAWRPLPAGVFLPALVKHAKLLGGEKNGGVITSCAWLLIALLLRCPRLHR